MKALIIKDLLNLKGQYKIIIAIFVFYAMISFGSSDASFLFGMISVIMVLLTITSISYDERSKWDKYALTMPVNRQDIVISKYLLGLILASVALVLNLIFTLLFSDLSTSESVAVPFALFGVSLLFLALVLPPLFKYGVEKGRFIMMMIFFVPTGVIIIASKMGNISIGNDILNNLPYILVISLIIAVGISIKASLRIYNNKEM